MKTFDELREGFKTDANRKAAFAKMNDKKTSEALNKDDKPFVKKLVGKLRKGSKTHAKQADDLEKAMTTEVKQPPKKEVMKVIGHTKNAVQGRAALRKKYGVSDKEADDIHDLAMDNFLKAIFTVLAEKKLRDKILPQIKKLGGVGYTSGVISGRYTYHSDKSRVDGKLIRRKRR